MKKLETNINLNSKIDLYFKIPILGRVDIYLLQLSSSLNDL